MPPRIVSGWSAKPTHVARILSPKGIYPAESISFREGAYIADEALCFTLVNYVEPYSEDEIYSELQWLTVGEIRTYGAVMLAVNRELGYSAFYPYTFDLRLECEPNSDLVSWATQFVRPLLLEQLLAPDVQNPGFVAIAANPYRSSTDIPLPLIAGGPPYSFRKGVIDQTLAQDLFNEIDPEDALTIRGVATYMKAAMLHFHNSSLKKP